MSLIDPEYELIDPCPDLHITFLQYNDQFFDGKLIACEVTWSKRMTKCAGLCQFQPRSGYCSIRLSEPLLKLRPRKDFVETLLHEMIHAYLFLTSRIMDRDGHGADFQFHMHRINKIAGTSISIYHSFHAEVRQYQQHWWRCDGRCKDMRPFFGWVKRSMNRAPGKNDLWWGNHQKICGGSFIKVKEPEKTKKKKSKKDDNVEDGKKPKTKRRKSPKKSPRKSPKKSPGKSPGKSPEKAVEERFPGIGQKLGGDPSVKQSRLITEFFPTLKTEKEPSSDTVDSTKSSNQKTGESGSSSGTVDFGKLPNLKTEKKEPSSTTVDSDPNDQGTIPLIQLEHDDFGWDDEDIIVLDFDDMVAINEMDTEPQPGCSKSDDGYTKPMKRKSDEERPGSSKMIKIEADNEIQILSSSSGISAVRNNTEMNLEMGFLVDCPACTKKFTMMEINDHLDVCAA
ncbi:hypothetical protein FO519_008963 [Halicephalobus sp. NKZ332]|nr:hypothetical protein FO519_008963 [Halicephalobus sp. NKZ332]